MDSNVKERIEIFCKSQKISKREFERRIGASNGFASNVSKGIGNEKMSAIKQQFPELNSMWLLYGEGDMLINTENNSVNVANIGTNKGTVNQSTASEVQSNEEKTLYQKIVSLLEQQIEQLKEEKRLFLERVGCKSYDEVSKKMDDLNK